MSRQIVPAIDSPCPKDWKQMQGDGKRRYCEHCQLHVHNLSAMSPSEQRSLLASAQDRICVAYDESASIAVRSGLWRWWKGLTATLRAGMALVTAILPVLSSCQTTKPSRGADPMVRDLHQSADGSLKLGKVKVEPENASSQESEFERLVKSGKMVAGGIMPAPLPWWKRLFHNR